MKRPDREEPKRDDREKKERGSCLCVWVGRRRLLLELREHGVRKSDDVATSSKDVEAVGRKTGQSGGQRANFRGGLRTTAFRKDS